ncbi:MAG TPA: hypothetical protein VML54_09215 [Candidatus Limnocylindrales bacterium]|nr:hypothetical protein [Candidatus Limnocylindrales bacterium]
MALTTAVRSPTLMHAAVGLMAVAVWWSWVYDIDLVYAMKGFSPIGWVYKTVHPGDFALDFAGGTDNYGRSAFMHVYPAAHALGMSPETLMPVMIAFEIVLFSWAMFVLCRVLLPDAPPVVAALAVVLTIATPVRDMNLAYFPQPYFVGQYYNVADSLRIFGIVMVLRGRPLSAAALLAGSFATHPALGLMGLACAAAMSLVRPREILRARYLAAAALFGLIAGGWLVLQFRSATISGGQIPVQDWLDLTRAFSYHWYPVDNGMRTSHRQQYVLYVLLPFASFLLMLAYYWPRRDMRSEVTNKAWVGMLAMLGLSIVGLVISAVVPVPGLIKLALQRSNDLVIMIGLVFVVAGLWRDLRGDQWWRRALAATVLVSLCRRQSIGWSVSAAELPLLWSIVLVSPALRRVLRRPLASAADWTVAGLAATCGGLGVIYAFTGMTAAVEPLDFLGGRRALLLLGAFLVLGAVFARWDGKRVLPGCAVAAVVAFALVGLQERAVNKVDTALAGAYLQAQVWARDHTPRTALFMPDPTFYYGWRDYSRRSSFGNLREWLHTSWIYDSNFERYQEGMQRFNEFNIDIGPYLRGNPPIGAVRRLSQAVKERYYTASDEWRLGLAQRYGIGYFVFRRKEMVQPSRLPVVYENEHFVIRAARE